MTYEYRSLIDVSDDTLTEYGRAGWRVVSAVPERVGHRVFWTALIVREVPRG